jgi:Zn finger protein HypA/HybF involved in hydrogenase expression
LWAGIPDSSKKDILSNVWCGKCRHEITITNFSGTVSSGDLLLVGVCAECHSDVAKLILGAELRSD